MSLIYAVVIFGFNPSDYSIDESVCSQTVSVVHTGAIDRVLRFFISANTDEANPDATATGNNYYEPHLRMTHFSSFFSWIGLYCSE